MLKKNLILPAFVRILYHAFQADEKIITEAKETTRNSTRGQRTEEQHFYDCLRGIALQYAVKLWLCYLGYIIRDPPPDVKHYDFEVLINERWVKVDVKGRFSGKYFQQTEWESHAVPSRGNDVLYICIDELLAEKNQATVDSFRHTGQCWSKDLLPGEHGRPFVPPSGFSEVI